MTIVLCADFIVRQGKKGIMKLSIALYAMLDEMYYCQIKKTSSCLAKRRVERDSYGRS